MYNTTKPYTKKILDLIKQTWDTQYVSVNDWIVNKKFLYPEYHHTDGIGTKGVYHWAKRSFKNAVLDALRMNTNDLTMFRATPYAVIDHLLIPEDDEAAILEIVNELSGECKKNNIAITGGETAIHDNLVGMDISVSMLGFVKDAKKNQFKCGDVLIGIESNGLHSNGFSLVRQVFKDEFRYDFIKPTLDYSLIIHDLLEKGFDINGMMHITGGAYSKLKQLLNGCSIFINNRHSINPQEIFLS